MVFAEGDGIGIPIINLSLLFQICQYIIDLTYTIGRVGLI